MLKNYILYVREILCGKLKRIVTSHMFQWQSHCDAKPYTDRGNNNRGMLAQEESNLFK